MTLLITYTRTDEGEAALTQGRTLAASLAKPVVVFTLEDPSHADDRRVTPPAGVAVDGERWFGPAHTAPLDAAEELLDTAQELDAEMIVVGIRRRSRVGKFLLGSQAQRIILGASVPVVAVKIPGEGE